MNGALARPERLADLLRESERAIGFRQDSMSSLHDVDGGVGAGQWGLVLHGCRDLVRHATLLALSARGVRPVAHVRREREWLLAIDALEVVDSELSDEAWALYLAPVPDESSTQQLCQRTFAFVGRCTGLAGDLTRGTSLADWSDQAAVFRETCRRLGVPIADDWYFAAGDEDWPEEVRRWIAQEPAEDAGRPNDTSASSRKPGNAVQSNHEERSACPSP